MASNKRKIYDNDGTLVEQIFVSDDAVVETPSYKSYEPKKINVSDIIDTFAGYLLPRLEIESDTDKGECILCGKQTSKGNRKICFECFVSNKDEIYNKTKESIKNGEMSFFL